MKEKYTAKSTGTKGIALKQRLVITKNVIADMQAFGAILLGAQLPISARLGGIKMANLEPCPFCGSSDIGLGWRLPLFGEETTKFVVCNCFGCMTAPFRNENEAVEIWNKRADNG